MLCGGVVGGDKYKGRGRVDLLGDVLSIGGGRFLVV